MGFVAEATDASEIEDIVVIKHQGTGPHETLKQKLGLAHTHSLRTRRTYSILIIDMRANLEWLEDAGRTIGRDVQIG